MSDKLDIFEVLPKLDEFDFAYFEGLTDDQKKTLPPFLLLQWMAGCKSEEQLLKVNSLFNYYVFDLGKHPDLLYKLALISSDGKPKKYNWIKKKGKGKKYSNTIAILRRYYKCSSQTALDYIPLLEFADVEQMAYDLGEQEDTIKKIKNELL